MPDNNTPRRTFRCEDEVWIPAQAKAKAEGTNASEVIRRLLSEWLQEGTK